MKVKLENGEVLKAEWIEVWREDNSILVGTKDDVLNHLKNTSSGLL